MVAAKLLGKRTHQAPGNYTIPSPPQHDPTHQTQSAGKLLISELFFEVPKDYLNPSNGTLRLFARSVERFQKPVDLDASEKNKHPQWLVYLQGGPGMPCKSPQNYSWTNAFLDKGYQILFLDQRGTGLSSTVTARTLAREGGPVQQAAFLKYFRADSIVKDCEAIRRVLTEKYPEEKKKWSLIGQSFGGFCSVNYLSRFPSGLREVFTIGGLPPLVRHPDLAYKYLFRKVLDRNRIYYEKYPEDNHRVKDVIRYIEKESVLLPNGGNLSTLRLRQLGYLFGYHGSMDAVHEMICRFISDLNQFGFFTRPTLAQFGDIMPFDLMPLYALMHEPCYARGSAPNWSADRSMKQYPEFYNASLEGPNPVYFFGEMIFRDMYKDYDELRSLQETADILESSDDWPELYDEAQLARNEVPVYSATFVEDMYVQFDLARDTASKIKNCKTFVTNMLYHDALGSKTDEVVKQLFALRDDTLD